MPNRQSWYEIRAENAATKGVADVYLYDEIGYWGVPASAFVRELNELDVETINVFLNSPGGEVGDGIAIFNALKRNKAAVHVTVDGSALSIASVIAQAGDKRRMAQGAAMMIHEPWIGAMGDADFMRKMAEQLDKDADEIAEIYADRAGGEASEWRDRMKDETWYRPQEAVAAGLADEVVTFSTGSKNLALGRRFDLAKCKNMPEWAKTALRAPDPAASESDPALYDADHGWQFLAHHGPDGAVDVALLRVALARVKDLSIPVSNRKTALHHLNGHAQVAARAA